MYRIVILLLVIGWLNPMLTAEEKHTRFPILDQKEAWTKLPHAEKGKDTPLPIWARITAGVLPRTTANMLELDDFHRTLSPLDPKLRAMARWIVADANRCAGTRAVALADLRKAGATDAEINALTEDRTKLPPETQRILTVAKNLTLAAYKVTDAQMAAIRKDLGDKKLVALVQLIAYGNFQDRLFHSLGIAESAELVTGIRFKRPFEGGPAPERSKPMAEIMDHTLEKVVDPEWKAIDFSALQKSMDSQRGREGRVSVPTFEDVKQYLPKDAKPLKIKWSLVCLGHSPDLARPWTAGMRLFAEESKQDRVFEELLFWVITRENQCFY
jgi:alkylhydroperoxidase family enzyme